MTPAAFRKIVWNHYRAHGRYDLLWRKTKDPYKILVSEVMLQQTQVDRVAPFYTEFIKKFPTAKKLSIAPLSEVLKAWQGLGYNRRAKLLHAAAKEIVHEGMPRDAVSLEKLPGVGFYTARAVAAFAWNEDGIVIETNIRTAVIHHFFPENQDVQHPVLHTRVADAEIAEVLARVIPKGRAREWYSALMDYGAWLKRSGISHNARTKGYAKQTKFAGSLRQARGAILRELAKGPANEARIRGLLGDNRRAQLRTALDALCAEGLVMKDGRRFALAH
jgi:A/G-specific adenine glycosylase